VFNSLFITPGFRVRVPDGFAAILRPGMTI
jgi:hypothetical protein